MPAMTGNVPAVGDIAKNEEDRSHGVCVLLGFAPSFFFFITNAVIFENCIFSRHALLVPSSFCLLLVHSLIKLFLSLVY